jgi:hypothetical protein
MADDGETEGNEHLTTHPADRRKDLDEFQRSIVINVLNWIVKKKAFQFGPGVVKGG